MSVDLFYFIKDFFQISPLFLKFQKRSLGSLEGYFSSLRVLIMDQNHTIRSYLLCYLISEVQYQISYNGGDKHMVKLLGISLPRVLWCLHTIGEDPLKQNTFSPAPLTPKKEGPFPTVPELAICQGMES